MSFLALILAAGMGTRMKSSRPKVIHTVCGKPLAMCVIDASKAAGADKVCAVVGHCADMVKETLGGACEYTLQAEQKGTGHAVMQAMDFIKSADGEIVILNGDTPLVTAGAIKDAVEYHRMSGNKATVITAILPDAAGYGRIVRGADGGVKKIVEQKDATDEEKKINEVNSGMYVFDAQSLAYALTKLTPNNAQGEYYLTDTLEILLAAGEKVGGYAIADNDEIRGINDRVQLYEAEKIMRRRINEKHMRAGVTIRDIDSVCIEDGVTIGADTEIDGNVTIKNGTVIGEGCYIGGTTTVDNSEICDGAHILSSVILNSKIGKNTNVGPFAYVRPNCVIGDNVKVGDFVEVKNSTIGSGTKISHLTYIGDSDVGERVNFGCGTVTCNYDGKKKFRTTIGDDCFIGCNTNLVSPVSVGDGAYIAAGSTITDDIPDNALAIARQRQVNKNTWKDKRGE